MFASLTTLLVIQRRAALLFVTDFMGYRRVKLGVMDRNMAEPSPGVGGPCDNIAEKFAAILSFGLLCSVESK
jgi:hypothetical protein